MKVNDINRKKFIFRTIVLLFSFGIALYDIELLKEILYFDLKYFQVYHIIWLFLMLGMLQVFIPYFNNHVSCGKAFAKHFKESTIVCDKEVLKESIRKNNLGAIKSALFWLLLLFIIWVLYYLNIISQTAIHLIVVFFYFSDQFCINIWCPFRVWFIKNKCCNSCRIYNWGHFMMFSPYIFIPSFWTYSLVFMSFLILIQWEYMHYRYPQRFLEISNANLLCSNCLKAKCRYIKSLSQISSTS